MMPVQTASKMITKLEDNDRVVSLFDLNKEKVNTFKTQIKNEESNLKLAHSAELARLASNHLMSSSLNKGLDNELAPTNNNSVMSEEGPQDSEHTVAKFAVNRGERDHANSSFLGVEVERFRSTLTVHNPNKGQRDLEKNSSVPIRVHHIPDIVITSEDIKQTAGNWQIFYSRALRYLQATHCHDLHPGDYLCCDSLSGEPSKCFAYYDGTSLLGTVKDMENPQLDQQTQEICKHSIHNSISS